MEALRHMKDTGSRVLKGIPFCLERKAEERDPRRERLMKFTRVYLSFGEV